MQPKFQPTRGGAQRRNVKTETAHQLRDENTDAEEKSNEGADSLAKGSSLGDVGSDSEKESGNKARSILVGDSEPMTGDVVKVKMLRFTDSLHWKVKGAEKYFPEVFEVIGSNDPSARVAEATTNPTEEATGTESVGLAAQLPTSTLSTSGALKSRETWKQLKLFAEELGTFVNKAITATLQSYVSLHAHIDDIEARVNDELKDLIILDLTKFVAKLKKAQDDIDKLQQERQTWEFLIQVFVESEEEEAFIDLLGEQPKAAGKRPREGAGDETKSHKKKHKKRKQEKAELREAQRLSRLEEEMRLKEILAPRVEEHTTGVIVFSESQTLLTLPPTAKVVPHDTISASVTTGTIAEVPRVTPPQTDMPDSRA
ncbi:hypothetical protein HAX54_037178 [Datura stramonium]|uniref:Uncharacterized protein n=1 Tax=Datura stramonium TaxID=4076 RepID=A0ABS8VHY5_DATST|nr:hypothetical protein [Datura stramonium]